MHACVYLRTHTSRKMSDHVGNRKIRRLKPINKIIVSPRASLCITPRAEKTAQSSGETHSSRAETANPRELNKWSIRRAANRPAHAAVRVLPQHFLVCPGFPGVLKESDISSWCAPHTQQR